MSEVKGSVSNVAWMQGRDACIYSDDHKTFYDFGRLKSNTVHYRVHHFPANIRRRQNSKGQQGDTKSTLRTLKYLATPNEVYSLGLLSAGICIACLLGQARVALEDYLFNVVVSSADCIWVSRKWNYTR